MITPPRPALLFGALLVVLSGLLGWTWFGSIPYWVEGYGLMVQNPGYTRVVITAPTDGEITELLIRGEDIVSVGQVIARLTLDDESGIIDIVSNYDGTVSRVNVRVGEEVRVGTTLVALRGELLETEQPRLMEAVLYLAYEDVQMVDVGMTVFVVPAGVSTLSYGYLSGRVASLDPFPATDTFARGISPDQPVVAVRVRLDSEPEGHYRWTLADSPSLELRAGMQLVGKILLREERPIDRVIRLLHDER